MRILVDATCAEFGGIRTVVDNLLPAWIRSFPDDDVHVLGVAGVDLDLGGAQGHQIDVPRPRSLGRPVAQAAAMRRLVRRLRPDVVYATLPATTVLRPAGVPLAVLVHDLRDELCPEQFSTKQRLLRKVSYGRSYRIADGFVSVSQRSLSDLHSLHPDTRSVPSVVAPLGADHVDAWPRAGRGHGRAVTFGHHANKNVGLVLDAWALDPTLPPVVIVGVPAGDRAHLRESLGRKGLRARVEIAPFLPADQFQELLAGAALVVLPSDFEGFGLPAIEAMRLGVPVVIGPERAALEVCGDYAHVAAAFESAAFAKAARTALAADAGATGAARSHAGTYTWARTADRTRGLLCELVAGPKPSLLD